MEKVVIDTNIFVSSFYGGHPRRIIDFWKQKQFTLCVSGAIIDEYTAVLRRLNLHDTVGVEELLALFAENINILFTSKTPTVKIVKEDPDDDKFVECAVALRSNFIVTGDKALLRIANYMEIDIVSPADFVTEFQSKVFA